MSTEIDIVALQKAIGHSVETVDVASARMAADFRATLEPYLAQVDEGSSPLAMHWCLAPGAAPIAALSADGTPRGSSFIPAVPLPRRMWAGGEITTLAPIPLGAAVSRLSTIKDISLKRGRTGQLLFVTIDHDYRVDGVLAVRDRQDAVFREAAGEIATAPPVGAAAAPLPADETWTVEPSAALLFRYSAVTFNTHRIHYDRPYTTGVEGYAGLIVHGPLQGSLAFNLAARMGGGAPQRFPYRNLSPLTDDAPFHVKGKRQTDGSIAVWTEDHAGRQCMSGVAHWG
jgi:3-methylfumaryl-CoA hydratase